MLNKSHPRGNAVVELALLLPVLLALMLAFVHLGWMFLRQIQLERLAFFLARDLAATAAPEPHLFASQWLRERRFSDIRARVVVRPVPQSSLPLNIVSLSLERPFSGGLMLKAHAREVEL